MKYSIFVKPGSKKGPLVVENPNAPASLTVFLRERPHDGAANSALIKLLSEYFDVPKTSIKLLSGASSRHKILEIPQKSKKPQKTPCQSQKSALY